MTMMEFLDTFQENLRLLMGPELYDVAPLDWNHFIPEIFILMQSFIQNGGITSDGVHWWNETGGNYLREIADSHFLMIESEGEDLSHLQLPPSINVVRLITHELITNNSNVSLLWPKNTYGSQDFERDLGLLTNVGGYRGFWPITIQSNSPLPNFLIITDQTPLTYEMMEANLPGFSQHYNMVTYSNNNFYVSENTGDLQELAEVLSRTLGKDVYLNGDKVASADIPNADRINLIASEPSEESVDQGQTPLDDQGNTPSNDTIKKALIGLILGSVLVLIVCSLTTGIPFTVDISPFAYTI